VRWGTFFRHDAGIVRRHLTRLRGHSRYRVAKASLAALGTLSAVRRRGSFGAVAPYFFSGFLPPGTSISKPFSTIETVE
jgi:hypothetical protein